MLSQSTSHVAVKNDSFAERLSMYRAIFNYADEVFRKIECKVPSTLQTIVKLIAKRGELGLQILASFIDTLKELKDSIDHTGALVYKLDTFLESALNTGLRFGKEFDELYVIPFGGIPQLHIGYKVFIKEVQRLFNIRLVFTLYHKQELDEFNRLNGTNSDLDYCVPDEIPHKLIYQNFKSFDELQAVKVLEINTATEYERVFKLSANKVIKAGALVFFRNKLNNPKSCWKTHPTEMIYKTVVAQYIKTHFRDRAIDDRLKRIIDVDDQLNMAN